MFSSAPDHIAGYAGEGKGERERERDKGRDSRKTRELVQRRPVTMSEARLSTIILVCAAIGVGTYLTGSAENIWRKVKLVGVGAVHMLLSKDKKFKPEVRLRVRAWFCWCRPCVKTAREASFRHGSSCRNDGRVSIRNGSISGNMDSLQPAVA